MTRLFYFLPYLVMMGLSLLLFNFCGSPQEETKPVVSAVTSSVAMEASHEGKHEPLPESSLEGIKNAIVKLFVTSLPEYYPTRRFGSGFLVTPDGLLLTNYHVVEPMISDTQGNDLVVQVFYGKDGHKNNQFELYYGDVVSYDQYIDIALVKISGLRRDKDQKYFVRGTQSVNEQFPFLQLGDSNQVSEGNTVYVLGYPERPGYLGDLRELPISYTEGAVKGLLDHGQFLEVKAEVDQGNSGGPALLKMDKNGNQVVGVVTELRWTSRGVHDTILIPINYALGCIGDPYIETIRTAQSSASTALQLQKIEQRTCKIIWPIADYLLPDIDSVILLTAQQVDLIKSAKGDLHTAKELEELNIKPISSAQMTTMLGKGEDQVEYQALIMPQVPVQNNAPVEYIFVVIANKPIFDGYTVASQTIRLENIREYWLPSFTLKSGNTSNNSVNASILVSYLKSDRPNHSSFSFVPFLDEEQGFAAEYKGLFNDPTSNQIANYFELQDIHALEIKYDSTSSEMLLVMDIRFVDPNAAEMDQESRRKMIAGLFADATPPYFYISTQRNLKIHDYIYAAIVFHFSDQTQVGIIQINQLAQSYQEENPEGFLLSKLYFD